MKKKTVFYTLFFVKSSKYRQNGSHTLIYKDELSSFNDKLWWDPLTELGHLADTIGGIYTLDSKTVLMVVAET